ncbi:MAG: TAXI family TRAP transporter solute-binding subunit [Deltaproteobacteria bacterium]|nr:TAXI family TRAP transporter solute-binding subunit [Deltaproteobacteria bacterium]
MRARFLIPVCLFVTAALIFFAPDRAAAQVKRISILTASTGGVWYIVGAGLAKIISTHVPNVEATSEVTGGGLENIRLLLRGKADFIMTTDAQILNLMKDEEPRKKSDFRALFTGIASAFQVVVKEDSLIKSIADLKGQRLGTPSLNDGGEIMARVALEVYGLTYKDGKSVKHLSLGELANAFKDGFVDAFLAGGGVPMSSVVDVTLARKCRMIPLEEDKLQKLLEKYPEYTRSAIRKGAYKGVDRDLLSFGTRTALVTLSTTSDDLVYQITKAVLENTNELAAIHPQGQTYNIQEALLGIRTIPIHSGAIRYYKEKGAWEKRPAGVLAGW